MCNNLVQQAIMYLLNRSDSQYGQGKRFYGYFLLSMRKHYDHPEVPTAGVNITNQLNLYINTKFFKSLNIPERIDLLEHECDHIIKYHQKRFKNLDKADAKLWNIACDATINYKLKALQASDKIDIVTVEKLRKFVPTLEDNQSAEYYFEKLKQYREQNGGKGGQGEKNLTGENGQGGQGGELVDNHDVWGKSEDLSDQSDSETSQGHIDEIQKQIVKKAMQDAVDSCDGRGNVPMDIIRELDKLGAATVNWKQQLKQFLAKADKFSKEPTRKKLNRRYKHLNPGRRKKPQTCIAIGVDESGSVSDSLHKQFFAEIDAAARLDGIKFVIINSDCQVNKVFDYEPGMTIERTGMGGTAYMPAINKANELKVDGMIYFGDGDIFGEKLTQPKFPFLWAMEDGRNAPAEWGRVCHVKYPKGDNNDW